MEYNDFVKKFAEIFDDTDISELTPDSKFRELDEWTSLSALSLLAMADEEFGVELDAIELRKAETVKDVFNILNK